MALKWQYISSFGELSDGELNKMGAEGWELCATIDMGNVHDSPQHRLIFKRPEPSQDLTRSAIEEWAAQPEAEGARGIFERREPSAE